MCILSSSFYSLLSKCLLRVPDEDALLNRAYRSLTVLTESVLLPKINKLSINEREETACNCCCCCCCYCNVTKINKLA